MKKLVDNMFKTVEIKKALDFIEGSRELLSSVN